MKARRARKWSKGTGLRPWLLYVAVRMVFAVMQVFPIDWNLRTARWLAQVWIRLMPRHRDRAIEHLTASLGDTYSPEKIRDIAVRSLESTVMFAVEAICLPRLISRSTWSRHINAVNFRETLDLIVEGRGLILVTGHYGSFELIGHLLACVGHPIAAVMRPLDNVYLNRFLVRTRAMRGLTLLDKKGAMARARSTVESGTLLGFIGDQDAGSRGVFVDFFGRPASTYKSIGLLAMATHRPIVVGYARRCGNVAQYEIGAQRIIHPYEWESQEDPLRWITATYTAEIEAIVRKAPEQYLWAHRRWKSQPGERPALRQRASSTALS